MTTIHFRYIHNSLNANTPKPFQSQSTTAPSLRTLSTPGVLVPCHSTDPTNRDVSVRCRDVSFRFYRMPALQMEPPTLNPKTQNPAPSAQRPAPSAQSP